MRVAVSGATIVVLASVAALAAPPVAQDTAPSGDTAVTDAVLKEFLRACETKGLALDCYDVGIQYMQKYEDAKAVEYFRRACAKGLGTGCFSVTRILIRELPTRDEGLKALQKACAASRDAASDKGEKEATADACPLIDEMRKHPGLPYDALIDKLPWKELFWFQTGAGRASFDCSKASTHVEKLICLDMHAADLDGHLATVYRSVVGSSPDPAALKAEQHVWLTNDRNKCADTACVRGAYERRLAVLKAVSPPATTTTPRPLPAPDGLPASFVGAPFVRPQVVERLTESQQSDSKAPPEDAVQVDLSDKKKVETFLGDAETREMKGEGIYVYYEDKSDPDVSPNFGFPGFGYIWKGRTASGVDALLTLESGGGSMVSVSLLLVSLERGPGANVLRLKRVRQVDLGDRWEGRIEVKDDTVKIGKDTGNLGDRVRTKPQVIRVNYHRPTP